MVKNRYYTLVVCGIFFLSCNWSFAQKKPDIKGNRTVAVVDKALDAFNSIDPPIKIQNHTLKKTHINLTIQAQ
jgi:hypothetical protein